MEEEKEVVDEIKEMERKKNHKNRPRKYLISEDLTRVKYEELARKRYLERVKTKEIPTDSRIQKIVKKGVAILINDISYEFVPFKEGVLPNDFRVEVEKGRSLKHLHFTDMKPKTTDWSFTVENGVSISFSSFNNIIKEALETLNLMIRVEARVCIRGDNGEENEVKCEQASIYGHEKVHIKSDFAPNKVYSLMYRFTVPGLYTQWSDAIAFEPEDKTYWSWKKCPPKNIFSRYSVDERNTKIATNVNKSFRSTIIGSTPLPLNKVTSWHIKILKSRDNNGEGIYIGVAPSDINQDDSVDYTKCGWYFNCHRSTLYSGLLHYYKWPGKEYGPRKEEGEYIHTGDSIGVVMDPAKGNLSFAVNRVNLGVAYEGIPLDKPLVPCVILENENDSVELDTSEVKENMDALIQPSNIKAKRITWDSITLKWDAVEGASFYQMEMDGDIICDVLTARAFTKRGLLPQTEHSFRVRAVKGNSVSEWSYIVKGRTKKVPEFSKCAWKKCPDDVIKEKKYTVNSANKCIVENTYEGKRTINCTVIGNTYFPPKSISIFHQSVEVKKRGGRENGHILWRCTA